MNQPNYSICSNERLRMLCIANNYFTHGSNTQYEKMFDMNREGAPLHDIAVVIWLCSSEEASLLQVEEKLKNIQKEYKNQEEIEEEIEYPF